MTKRLTDTQTLNRRITVAEGHHAWLLTTVASTAATNIHKYSAIVCGMPLLLTGKAKAVYSKQYATVPL
jgi:hypothetical protein